MAGPFFYDRVKETTTTTGTGTINLAGAVSTFRTFVSTVGNSNTCFYAIVGTTTGEWEVGIGTVTSGSPDTLSRTTVLASTNSNALVNFSAGTKDVFCTLPASYFPSPISLGSILYGNTSGSLSNLSGSTSAVMAVLTQTGNGSASAAPVWSATTGTGNIVRSTSPTLVKPVLGTPTSGNLTNCTLPVTAITTTSGTTSSLYYLRGDGTWSVLSNAHVISTNITIDSSRSYIQSRYVEISYGMALTLSSNADLEIL